eukprot:CAMPEP_0119129388 /NCGR_PEP_ID=MMETSP1310-20130426/7157_1 /TAXON_ID=464262 /ORGANISM="Genus nov. species nov., Strain RCC2339" /LENGTH=701 /DNA_ID=CAMNT_0007119807 /DNA_START=52 /DNA_END=2157 /DNA_ORIENTATION=-
MAGENDLEDKYLEYEEVDNLDWVKEQNARSVGLLEQLPGFAGRVSVTKEMLDDPEKLPAASQVVRDGAYVYNFVEHGAYPRGLVRRCKVEEFHEPAADVPWEPLLDIAKLNEEEGRSWVLQARSLHLIYRGRMLVLLSDGGSDAKHVREFDVEAQSFLEGATTFGICKEAKTSISWVDANTVLVGTDCGADSLTDSGYPRTVRRWKRGQPLGEAEVLFEGEKADVSVSGSCYHFSKDGEPVVVIRRALDFWKSRVWVLDSPSGNTLLPMAAKRDLDEVSLWHEFVIIQLREDWPEHSWVAGTLLVGKRSSFMGGEGAGALKELFVPTANTFLEGYTTTRSAILCSVLKDVVGGVVEFTRGAAAGEWARRDVKTPSPGALTLHSLWDSDCDDDVSDTWWAWYADFLTPSSILHFRVGSDESCVLLRRKAKWDSRNHTVEQHFVQSSGGVRVPYFLVRPKNRDGPVPCILYGYGGFEVSMTPWYSNVFGKLWLEPGNAFVLANIRGGGEYGPSWHMSALRENHQMCFDDFCNVASDLHRRKVTTPGMLGIEGGSNGGALVASCMLQHPELFSAVVCQCPLLDFRRYTKLHCGASWAGEYGDPDVPEDWAFLRRWSPYHNIPRKRDGVYLPRVLFTTSTRDDRVHPAHARKMVKRLGEYGHEGTTYLFENTEGGHANACDNRQRARIYSLEFSFMHHVLCGEGK